MSSYGVRAATKILSKNNYARISQHVLRNCITTYQHRNLCTTCTITLQSKDRQSEQAHQHRQTQQQHGVPLARTEMRHFSSRIFSFSRSVINSVRIPKRFYPTSTRLAVTNPSASTLPPPPPPPRMMKAQALRATSTATSPAPATTNTSKAPHTVLVDGTSLAYRAFYAASRQQKLMNRDGLSVNALATYTRMIVAMTRAKSDPADNIAIFFDGGVSSHRLAIHEGYKAHRETLPEEFKRQLPLIKEVTKLLGIPLIEKEGLEADDMIASYALFTSKKLGHRVTVVSPDKDLLQVIDDNISVYDPSKSQKLGAAEVKQLFGVLPKQLAGLKALAGDKGDNISGVAGVGPKTAAVLLQQFGTIDALLRDYEKIANPILRSRIQSSADSIRQGHLISKLMYNVEMPVPVSKLKHQPPTDQLLAFLSNNGLRSIAMELHNAGVVPDKKTAKEVPAKPAISNTTPTIPSATPTATASAAAEAHTQQTKKRGANTAPKATETADKPEEPSPHAATKATPKRGSKTDATRKQQETTDAEASAEYTEGQEAQEAPKKKKKSKAKMKAEAALPQVEETLQDNFEIVDTVEKLNKWIAAAEKKGIVAFATHVGTPKPHDPILSGISLCIEADGKACYVPLINKAPPPAATTEQGDSKEANSVEEEELDLPQSVSMLRNNKLLRKLKGLLENNDVVKVGHNVKEHIKYLRPHGIDINNFDDIMVMSYVLECGKHNNDFEEMVVAFLGEEEKAKLRPLRDILGVGKKAAPFYKGNLVSVTNYAAHRTQLIQRMFDILNPRLDDENLRQFYEEIELPMVATLADMELTGIVLSREVLRACGEDFQARIDVIVEEIYKESGSSDWNINSSKQLGEVLFDRMNLGADLVNEKNQHGLYSCNSEVMQKLADKGHKLPELILKYRALTKLKSTYVEGLLDQINPYTQRVHTCFQNALTNTGRLSSVNPNLQNIPIRSQDGKLIRKAFISKPGHKLIKADYSQVELRVLAHVADIDVLKQAFRDGKDVHAITASQVFNVPVENVDKDLRRKAKAINFGIIYGMSEFGLSSQIGVTVEQAKEYIDSYFKQYPGIKDYMERTKDFCHENGYVNTLFGRRCYINDINHAEKYKQGFAERAAINTPIQGTAADITKIAMNRLHKFLKENKQFKTRMLLQIHDELVFEVPEDELETIKPIIKATMEGAVDEDFSVPLIVDAEVTTQWLTE